MVSKFSLSAVIAAAGLLAVALPVSAASLPALNLMKDNAAAQSQVEKTHGWHRLCRRGLNGWHKHIPGVGRHQCTTGKCWTNALGYKQCRYF